MTTHGIEMKKLIFHKQRWKKLSVMQIALGGYEYLSLGL